MTPNPRPVIVVLDDWERALPRLADWSAIGAQADLRFHHEPLRGDALLQTVQAADAVVLMRDRTPFQYPLVAQLPRLKLLVHTGTRNSTLDTAALHERGIPVCHTPWGPSKDSTCEWTWTLILAATKQLQARQQQLRDGQWRPPQPASLPGVLAGQTLGLIGLGEIGGRVARVGRAFGMRVLAWSPRMTPERAEAHGAVSVPLEQLLAESQVVSLHLVPTADTQHLLNAERLSLMSAGSLLVNTSRSALVDTNALVAALGQGRPAMAALDVFDTEPLPHDSPLRHLEHALLTPHMGFVSEPVYRTFAQGVTECLHAWLAGQALPRQVM